MAKVYIYADEFFFTTVEPVRDEDDFPHRYLPVEIPDDLAEAHQLAQDTERALRRMIMFGYRGSEYNPNYNEELLQWERDNLVDK